jgi:hypothetical protein
MKKLLAIFVLLIISAGVFSQQKKPVDTNNNSMPAVVKSQQDKPIKITTPNDYLRKSRTQKTFAWILAGIGAVFIIAPIADNKSTNTNNSGWFDFSGLEKSLDAYSYITGAVFIAGSVPLFIAGHRNKLKAQGQIGLMQLNGLPSGNYHAYKTPVIPSVGVKIYLR